MGNRARSEGASVSVLDGGVWRQVEVIELDADDDDVQEIKEPTPPGRQTSRLSLFVTPGPDEPRTTGTPETRWRSMSARQQPRRASSVPQVSPPDMTNSTVIDLTGEGSDKEVEYESFASRDDEGELEDDTTNGDDEAEDGVPDLFNPGTKRARLTSPASDGGGDTKRQKSKLTARSVSLPIAQTWSFPSV